MTRARRSGVLVPLFSLTSRQSWGVGDFGDLRHFTRWAADAGQAFVQILPITEVPARETSPYSALTAMALDPIYISLPGVEDFQALGGDAQLDGDDRRTLAALRTSGRVEHQRIRPLKSRCLRRSFERFATVERGRGSDRDRRFTRFVADEAWWLEDYALFQAIRGWQQSRPWWQWPAPLARREPAALERARHLLRTEIDFRQYEQWLAAGQWAAARAHAQPVQLFGDVPFMISGDSPDVWTRQDEFRLDATVGAPPDAFSETGQDWGLPPWRWDVMAARQFEWMRQRARRTASLFDGFRLDHLVGLYRTYIRPRDAACPPFFSPDEEAAQLRLGETLVRIYQATGAEVIAEDLGTVPDFVRASLQRLDVPGFKVLRWERAWDAPGQPFIDPLDYPEASVATTGTHDTEPLATWLMSLSEADRGRLRETPSLRRTSAAESSALDALLRALLAAPSRLAIIPVQDVFGWRDRINTPAQVDEHNWTWRLPWRVDELGDVAEARDRAATLAGWTRAAGR